jgi:hypothetical protein
MSGVFIVHTKTCSFLEERRVVRRANKKSRKKKREFEVHVDTVRQLAAVGGFDAGYLGARGGSGRHRHCSAGRRLRSAGVGGGGRERGW